MSRTDWKAQYVGLAAEYEKLEEEAVQLRADLQIKQGFIDELESQVEEAKKATERARIEGMHEATGLILRSERP